MGTPHRGSKLGGWAETLGNITKAALQAPNNELLHGLDAGSEVLDRIHRDFMSLLAKPDFMIHCFQEDRGPLGILGLSQQVVDFQSSKTGSPWENVETLTANHMSMVSYRDSTDPNYIKVSDALVDYVRQINEATSEAPAPRRGDFSASSSPE
jgi:hypothetical protein